MRIRIAIAVVALAVAACGGTSKSSEATATAGPTSTAAMEGVDAAMMNMGDPTATAAAAIAGADLMSGAFRVLATAPEGFDDVSGSAELARHDGGTTVTIELKNLIPNNDYVAHVHAGTCFDSGGPHYQFDPGASDMPPNEIHLAFTSAADGSGFMTAENHQVAGDTATAVVVHERVDGAPKIVCADLGR